MIYSLMPWILVIGGVTGLVFFTFIIGFLVFFKWEKAKENMKKNGNNMHRWQAISIWFIFTVISLLMVGTGYQSISKKSDEKIADSLEYQLASIDAGQYVKHGGKEEQRAGDAIFNALSVCNATGEEITGQAIKLSNILSDDGMPTRPIEILEGYKVILGESTENDCAETAAQYASVRKAGQSHAQAVYGLRSLFNTVNSILPKNSESQQKLEDAAMQGDYQAQRNLAFSYSNPYESKKEIKNPILACAWRLIILHSGSPKVDLSDQGNMEVYCGKLSSEDFDKSKRAAIDIMLEMEKKSS